MKRQSNFLENDIVNLTPSNVTFPKMTGRVFHIGCNDVMVSVNVAKPGHCYAMFDKITGKHSLTAGIPFQLDDYIITKA